MTATLPVTSRHLSDISGFQGQLKRRCRRKPEFQEDIGIDLRLQLAFLDAEAEFIRRRNRVQEFRRRRQFHHLSFFPFRSAGYKSALIYGHDTHSLENAGKTQLLETPRNAHLKPSRQANSPPSRCNPMKLFPKHQREKCKIANVTKQ